jgi:hypothetical protein
MVELNVKQQIPEEKNTCILCGDDLNHLEPNITERCDFCGKTTIVDYQCNSYHYICHDCYSGGPFEYITKRCLEYKGIDPIDLAVSIMNTPTIRMHGPEHHYIVPATLLTCVYNLQGKQNLLESKLKIALQREISESPQFCEYNKGFCGAAIGSGIFYSLFSDENTEIENAWSLTNTQIAESLKRVEKSGGPRCCKRDTYISILSAIDFLKDKFAIELPRSEAKCTFSMRNKSCKREDCEYFNISFDMV